MASMDSKFLFLIVLSSQCYIHVRSPLESRTTMYIMQRPRQKMIYTWRITASGKFTKFTHGACISTRGRENQFGAKRAQGGGPAGGLKKKLELKIDENGLFSSEITEKESLTVITIRRIYVPG